MVLIVCDSNMKRFLYTYRINFVDLLLYFNFNYFSLIVAYIF